MGARVVEAAGFAFVELFGGVGGQHGIDAFICGFVVAFFYQLFPVFLLLSIFLQRICQLEKVVSHFGIDKSGLQPLGCFFEVRLCAPGVFARGVIIHGEVIIPATQHAGADADGKCFA